MKSIEEVVEEVEGLIDTHFFNEFSETKSSQFLKKVISHQSTIEMRLLKKTWRTVNCSPKAMKVIREIQENLLCIGKRKELITKKPAQRRAGAAMLGWLSMPSTSSATARRSPERFVPDTTPW